MKELALIFRIKDTADLKPSPEQMQERMDWLADVIAQNKLADRGNTLLPGSASSKIISAVQVVLDGPFTANKEFVSGYVIVNTETIEEAVELAKSNPIFKIGGTIEIREVLNRVR